MILVSPSLQHPHGMSGAAGPQGMVRLGVCWGPQLMPGGRVVVRPFQNVSEYVGQDACGAQSWNVLDVDLPLSSEQEPGVALLNLRPWTQYAIFVRAITLTTAEEGRNYGAQSEVVYIRTMPAGMECWGGLGCPRWPQAGADVPTPAQPRQCHGMSSPCPTPRPTSWCAGSHPRSAMATSPTTWCCGSSWPRTWSSTSTTTATKVQEGYQGWCRDGDIPRLLRHWDGDGDAALPIATSRPEAAHQQCRHAFQLRGWPRSGAGCRGALLPLQPR